MVNRFLKVKSWFCTVGVVVILTVSVIPSSHAAVETLGETVTPLSFSYTPSFGFCDLGGGTETLKEVSNRLWHPSKEWVVGLSTLTVFTGALAWWYGFVNFGMFSKESSNDSKGQKMAAGNSSRDVLGNKEDWGILPKDMNREVLKHCDRRTLEILGRLNKSFYLACLQEFLLRDDADTPNFRSRHSEISKFPRITYPVKSKGENETIEFEINPENIIEISKIRTFMGMVIDFSWMPREHFFFIIIGGNIKKVRPDLLYFAPGGILPLRYDFLDCYETFSIFKCFNSTQKELKIHHPYPYFNRSEAGAAQVIAKILRYNTSVVTLSLSLHCIEDSGATVLAEALKKNSNITELDLKSNGIFTSGTIALAEALKVNPTLQKVSLYGNLPRLNYQTASPDNSGYYAIAEALKVNSTLERLEFPGDNINDLAYNSIITALKENKAGRKKPFTLNYTKHEYCKDYVRNSYSFPPLEGNPTV